MVRIKDVAEDAAGAAYMGLSAARGNFAERRRRRGESPEFKAAFAKASFISGWLNRKEAELLFALAAAVPSGHDIVEVGSYLGRSTAFLALGAGPGRTIHAVDPFDNGSIQLVRGERFDTSKQFLRNMEEIGVAARVEAHIGTSVEGAAAYDGRPIGLLFVDGDHSEKAVFEDGSLWAPHFAPGCVVAFDDIGWDGVTKGLKRLASGGFVPTPSRRLDKIALCGAEGAWPVRVRDITEDFDLASLQESSGRSRLRRLVLSGSKSGPSPHS